ncbi:MAG: thiamine diphosphokinase [Candidatus Marinimicrobia bacterium]|jgi:thiamine pyrophosphokinase|nr:thiamine diphosphokinase [Candidatus Neomarinimicrobiota bacterium]MBT3574910.1 thiamine diphosphokinase [Candidatus Neomarinimicrobiota bacterium]MBT3679707.1 thiamine diphosphokinase [Candidatus Neomarinimicrobiota bacterium]MBT3950810.1 thiamine diphosphokinase [Candidatus Neomarinimicrobiota bacterium]MBT4252401.1 thiamine diphosphokinase [Candidatus Neomarinimicrobiota bacterium]
MNVLIVLAGNPPSKTLLKTEMATTDLIIAVDGGFNVFHKYNLDPDLVLGDMDSANMENVGSIDVIPLLDQALTDLQKTLEYVFETQPVKSLTFLGGVGDRTDHLLHNLYICSSIDPQMKIIFKNELPPDNDISLEIIQRITPECDFDLRVTQGNTLSILPITDFGGLNSLGLEWEIVNQNHSQGFISQSNLVNKADLTFTIRSGCAYIAVYQ